MDKDLNLLIDKALTEPCDRTFSVVAEKSLSIPDAEKLAERVRRQASRLCREKRVTCQQILRSRDRLIFVVYGNTVPDSGFSAWCDASLKETENGMFGAISGLLLSPQWKLVSRVLRLIEESDSVMAEAIAVADVMRAALREKVDRLRVHSDCVALVQLWLKHRTDPRLDEIRRLAAQFHWFELRSVPRLHNQPADRLAKRILMRKFH